jgi:aspartyl-tRNA(Asn)/glutamyl-tRNA(Gln) amidotransferase subunit C
MSVTPQNIADIATLARLELDTERLQGVTESINQILTLVEQLESVPLDEVKPMAHPRDEHQRLRKDEVTEHNQRDQFQAIAPDAQQGLYVVPPVIE